MPSGALSPLETLQVGVLVTAGQDQRAIRLPEVSSAQGEHPHSERTELSLNLVATTFARALARPLVSKARASDA
jgi:hypothetical protein